MMLQSLLCFSFCCQFIASGNLLAAENSAAIATSDQSGESVNAAHQIQIDQTVRASLQQHVAAMLADLSPSGKAGYQYLVGKPYLPPDFNEQVLVELEQKPPASPLANLQNPPPKSAWSTNRAEMLAAYGISARPDAPDQPLQYVVNKKGEWVMNCFACHGGNTYGVSFPGAPNTTYMLQSLTEQVRRTKLRSKLPLSHMDLGSVFIPLGSSVGTSNAVMFGVALMNFRDKDLNVLRTRGPAAMTHHDMDAPAWWHFDRKSHMYIDGFADKGSKGLMQFMLIHQNGPEKFRNWAADFEDVYEFISQVKSPKYPLPIDAAKANRGAVVFTNNCAACHGQYSGTTKNYPELNVAMSEIGTDAVRHEALTPANRHHYGASWFADYGGQDNIDAPIGYTAPPLDGVWASAPYLHNGSVPTLDDLLHPDSRPKLWRRTSQSFDAEKVGVTYAVLDKLPSDYDSLPNYQRYWIFDSTQMGKSNAGHDFPNLLNESERSDLLEYLKRL